MWPTVQAAHAALVTSLEGVPKLRVYPDPEAVVDPPAAVLGPPDFAWDQTAGSWPTTATWTVAVCVGAGTGHALADLLDLVPLVSEAIESNTDMIIISATAGAFRSSSAELPAYFFTVEAAL
jgi:hypothetical protein